MPTQKKVTKKTTKATKSAKRVKVIAAKKKTKKSTQKKATSTKLKIKDNTKAKSIKPAKKGDTKEKKKSDKKAQKEQKSKQRFVKGLSVSNIEKEIQKLSDWEANKHHTTISKLFEFPSFISALAFIAKITVHAEVLQHHPDIELSYGKVKVKLTTHHTGGLTHLDFALAERIDGIVVRV